MMQMRRKITNSREANNTQELQEGRKRKREKRIPTDRTDVIKSSNEKRRIYIKQWYGVLSKEANLFPFSLHISL